tara:strand:+ start:929 stop:1138 length:210 start_codon:yes stop_codon:yes gene_type:complete
MATIKELTAVVEEQAVQMERLRARVSTLTDDLYQTRQEVENLRTRLAEDMQTVVSSVRANMVPSTNLVR